MNVDNNNTNTGNELKIADKNDLNELEKEPTVDTDMVHEEEKAQSTSKTTTQRKPKFPKKKKCIVSTTML